MTTVQWAELAADVTALLISVGVIALVVFIFYRLVKRLIKFGIEYYFQLKKLNKDGPPEERI